MVSRKIKFSSDRNCIEKRFERNTLDSVWQLAELGREVFLAVLTGVFIVSIKCIIGRIGMIG
jgi:hypothetical protein